MSAPSTKRQKVKEINDDDTTPKTTIKHIPSPYKRLYKGLHCHDPIKSLHFSTAITDIHRLSEVACNPELFHSQQDTIRSLVELMPGHIGGEHRIPAIIQIASIPDFKNIRNPTHMRQFIDIFNSKADFVFEFCDIKEPNHSSIFWLFDKGNWFLNAFPVDNLTFERICTICKSLIKQDWQICLARLSFSFKEKTVSIKITSMDLNTQPPGTRSTETTIMTFASFYVKYFKLLSLHVNDL